MTVIEPSQWQFGITTVDQSWGPQSVESIGGRP
jgi:hypothetical protein